MNFKIENNYISIINYPTLAKHFEKMAAKGWLIHKIYFGNFFIYKKITPEDLDFTITPYVVETQYSRKTKSELIEFQRVCESVGWNYATKTASLHIYFKMKGSSALSLQTDAEEEFKTLENLGKKYLTALYVQVPMFLIIYWYILRQLLTGVNGFKDAFPQLFSVLTPFLMLSFIIEIYEFKKFFKINREKISLGEGIQFSQSNFYLNKLTFLLTDLILIVFIIYFTYGILFLENRFLLFGIAPPLLIIVSFFFYRLFIKPSKLTMKSKKRGFILILVLATLIPIVFLSFLTMNLIARLDDHDSPNIEGYNVVSINDFKIDTVIEDGDLMRQASILVPVSYTYYSYSNESYESISTEYSKALTEDLAITLVKRYKTQAETSIDSKYNRKDIRIYLEEDIYHESTFNDKAGIDEDEFNTLKSDQITTAIETTISKMKEIGIKKAPDNLWGLDEAYFLNHSKSEIVLRQGKEVIFIDTTDLNFTDPEVIEIVKKELGFN
ncbi:MAG: DUF2812 domain-containing protein [Clostridium sp.]|nr:DUF2812 domain-containing protein [Clostridium sp.]